MSCPERLRARGGNNTGSCEENGLCFRRIKGKAACRAPSDKTVEGALDLAEENIRIRPTTEDRAVIRKGDTKGGTVVDETNRLIKCEGPEGSRTHVPLRKTHTSGAECVVLAMVVCHVAVEKVIVIPSHHARVRPNAAETTLNVVGCNGVKGAADVQEGSKAVRSRVDMAFNVIRKSRGSSLHGFVTEKAMLMRMYWSEPDALFHVP